MQAAVVEEGKRLGVKTVIDQDLVDQAVAEIVRDRRPANVV